MRWSSAATVLLVGTATATSPVTHVSPVVPTDVSIAGDYTGALRPQVHFSPPKGFMNDPNGLFRDARGMWHLYFQYNPTGLRAGNQHWGHATSEDLYHWTNQPIALFPPEERVYVFSGSAVVDVNNTSGFFPNQTNGVVAIFTLARYYEDGTGGPQTQAVAYSTDGGYSFQYYEGNPVINSTSSQFRDPQVVRFGSKWVMVVSWAQEFTLGFYISPDLLHWTHASNFSTHGLLGAQYECPNLVQMPVRDVPGGSVTGSAWVLVLSVQPGAPLGGSVTQYFPGDFNGTHFSPWDAATRLMDFGKDSYAAQYFYGIPETQNAVSLGWASNWQYAQDVPTGEREGWRSAMTLPRGQYLARAERVGWVIVNEIHNGLAPVLGASLGEHTWQGNGIARADAGTDAVYISVNVTGLNATTLTSSSTLNITLASVSGNEALKTGFYFAGDSPFFMDRRMASGAMSQNVFFTDRFSVADVWNTTSGSWRLELVADRSVVEAVVDGGAHAGTMTYFPNEPLSALSVGSEGMPKDVTVVVSVRGLESVWKPKK